MSEVSNHRWAIDAIEAGVARVEEDGTRFITVPASKLPAGAQVGQVFRVKRSGSKTTVELDEKATRDALAGSRTTIESAMAESRRRDPGGDVSL